MGADISFQKQPQLAARAKIGNLDMGRLAWSYLAFLPAFRLTILAVAAKLNLRAFPLRKLRAHFSGILPAFGKLLPPCVLPVSVP